MALLQIILTEILNMLIIVITLDIKIKKVLSVSKTKLEITKKALAHDGAINWNTLPDYCKSAPSLNVFKSVVLKYMYSFS